MNILMLTASMGTGGAETHVFTLAQTLVKLGHRVTVASEGGSLCPRLRAHGVRHLTLPLSSKRPDDLLFCYCQ